MKELYELLERYQICDYEKTSVDYCKLMLLSKCEGIKADVVFSGSKFEKLAIIRDLQILNITVERVYSYEEIKKGDKEYEEIMLSKNILVTNADFNSIFASDSFISRISRKVCRLLGIIEDNKLLKKSLYIDVPYWRLRREEIFEFTKNNLEELQCFYDMLGDDESRKALYEIIRCSAENDCYSLRQGKQLDKYWECYAHNPNEIWVNCGSAVGDTIIKYLNSGYDFRTIYAFEGAESEFKALETMIEMLPENIKSKIMAKNCYIGVNDGNDNFDHLFKDIPVSLINMDIEGAEMGVLSGAKNLIREKRPVLAVCAYHKATDLLDIPRLINDCVGDYVFFVRKYIGYEINALNEYVYYAVPKERLIK